MREEGKDGGKDGENAAPEGDARRRRIAWSVARYPRYRAAISALAWLPVFFLYFRETLSFEEVLELEALYYFTVVLFEVPSGWFSDRWGRIRTLRIGALALLASYAVFVFAGSFAALASGQVLLGFAMSMQSGSDTAYHYDALRALGRESEYAAREAAAERAAFLMVGISAFLGGVLGLLSLRAPYVFAFLGAFVALLMLLRFEPVASGERAGGAIQQLVRVVASLADAELRWCFSFALALYALVHVPYEFYQPWLDVLLRELGARDALGAEPADVAQGAPRMTAFYSGLVFATTSLLGSYVAGRSAAWSERFGSRRCLLAALIFASLICAGMGIAVEPGLAFVLVLRSVPMAFVNAPLRARIAPRVASSMRATWLSLQALASRFVFGIALLGLAHAAREGYLARAEEGESLRRLLAPLRVSMLVGLASVAVLAVTAARLPRTPRSRAD